MPDPRSPSTAKERYSTIVADPPWSYKTTLAVTGNAPGRTRQQGRSGTSYETLTVAEIAALPVSALALPDAHLYLWTTNSHVEHAWDVARSWGFEPKNLLTWCKRPKGMIGFGVYSQSTEFVLFARRGASIHTDRCATTWFEWARRAHSQKPEELQDMVERVSPGPYLELFARRRRIGWDVWGDEVESDVELTVRGR